MDTCLEHLNTLLQLDSKVKDAIHLAWVNLDGEAAVVDNRALLYRYLEADHGLDAQVYTPNKGELAYLDQWLSLGSLGQQEAGFAVNDTLFVVRQDQLLMSFTREVTAEHINAALALLLEARE